MSIDPMGSQHRRNKLALDEYEEILEYGQRNPEAMEGSCLAPKAPKGPNPKMQVQTLTVQLWKRWAHRAHRPAEPAHQVVEADVNMSTEMRLCAEMVWVAQLGNGPKSLLEMKQNG